MLSVNIEKKLDLFTLQADFSCDSGSLALFGASGAGKSMILQCIAGIEKPDKGIIKLNDNVLFDSERHINLPPQKRRIGYLFQDYALFPNMTVMQNIQTGMRNIPTHERKEKALDLIKMFRLEGLDHKRPATLSGGEKQRTALARIFASSPEVLLLDEPFASLDTHLKLELIPYIKEIIDDFKGKSILVSHSIDEVVRLCSDVVTIHNGITHPVENISQFYISIKEEYRKAGVILPDYRP